MIPGLVSKISESNLAAATTISPKTDLVHINSTTATTVIATIVPPYEGFSGIMVLSNESGNNITTVTTGNILRAATIPVSLAVPFLYSKSLGKWIPGAIS